MFKFFLIVCAALVFAGPARAQGNAITPAQLQELYDKANASYKIPYEQHLALIKASFTPDFRARMTMTVVIPGAAPQTMRHHMDYAELIEKAREGYDSMQTASITSTLSKIIIATDGRSATLREDTKIRRMSMPGPEGTLYGDAVSTCDDRLTLDANGALAVTGANCTMTFTITPEREL